MSKHKISFQLYSARNFPPLETVLEGLAKIGYDAVEPYYPLYGDDAAGYRRKVDAVGLVRRGAADPRHFEDGDAPSLATFRKKPGDHRAGEGEPRHDDEIAPRTGAPEPNLPTGQREVVRDDAGRGHGFPPYAERRFFNAVRPPVCGRSSCHMSSGSGGGGFRSERIGQIFELLRFDLLEADELYEGIVRHHRPRQVGRGLVLAELGKILLECRRRAHQRN